MPSAKSKPQEQKDQKKQKSLLGWLAKPAAANNSSSAINAPVTSSSPSGRDSIFETPLTKQRATLGIDSPVVGSATFTKSSDGGRSINETPPTSDPIDVDISSDEDQPSRAIKSVGDIYICASTLVVTATRVTGSHKAEDCYRRFRRRGM